MIFAYRVGMVLTLACLIGSPDRGVQSAPGGMVNRVSGTWKRVAEKTAVQPGDSLKVGDALVAETAGHLSVMSLANGELIDHPCTPVKEECRVFRLPFEPKPATGFFAYLSRLFVDARPRPALLAAVRSVDPDGPTHGVLDLHEGRVDVAPLLAALPDGEYRVECVGLDTRKERQVAGWRPGALAIMSLDPGLHALRVSDGDGATRGAAAVVLVLEQPSLEAVRVWQEFVNKTAGWHAVSRDVRDTVAFRVLSDLADRHVR